MFPTKIDVLAFRNPRRSIFVLPLACIYPSLSASRIIIWEAEKTWFILHSVVVCATICSTAKRHNYIREIRERRALSCSLSLKADGDRKVVFTAVGVAWQQLDMRARISEPRIRINKYKVKTLRLKP